MSWFVNSLANSLKLDDPDHDLDHNNNNPNPETDTETDNSNNNNDNSPTPNRGVKDDLTELSKTFTRQLWGVASFLAPPPPPTAADADGGFDGGDAAAIAGIRNDLSEIGGKFKTEISKLKGVSELTKMATSLLHLGDDGDLSVQDFADRGVVGVTDEVVGFVRDVAMHPETWLDFPLPHDFDDDQDFDLSDAQQEHALAVERLAPELAALRTELCLGYMTEGSFWKIYFVLVHPRLSRHDAVILSTPPIMQARAMLTQELQNRGKSRKSGSGNEEQLSVPIVDQSESIPVEIIPADPAPPAPSVQHDVVMDKHSIASTEELVIEKAVVEEVPRKYTVSEKSKNVVSVNEKDEDEDEEDDEWLKEETEATSFKGTPNPLTSHDDEDVSFSDLEEDDDA